MINIVEKMDSGTHGCHIIRSRLQDVIDLLEPDQGVRSILFSSHH